MIFGQETIPKSKAVHSQNSPHGQEHQILAPTNAGPPPKKYPHTTKLITEQKEYSQSQFLWNSQAAANVD
jgi:hypothetical protein